MCVGIAPAYIRYDSMGLHVDNFIALLNTARGARLLLK